MKKSLGFTMIELMVTIAIVAILTTLAAPSFKRLIQSNTMSGTVNSFLADLRYARSESIRRGGSVVVCRSDSPEAASPSCAASNSAGTKGWASGWIIFQDNDKGGTYNAGDNLLRVQSAISAVDAITEGTASVSTALTFTGTGRLQSLPAASTPLQLTFGGSSYATDVKRIVCVNLSGRARVTDSGSTTCSTDQ
jgi:type IV fimbrial biogenesis protein FimT